MRNKLSILMSFLVWCAIATAIANEGAKYGVSPAVTISCLLVLSVAVVMKGRNKVQDPHVYGAAVQREMWLRYIIEQLFRSNDFLNKAVNDDMYVLSGKIVHIPQEGTGPTVLKNNNTYPLTAVQRTDNDVTYPLDKYSTVPTHVPDVDLAEISYDKIPSVMRQHFGGLMQSISDDMLFKWLDELPSTHIIRTTGAATAATVTGQTGNRLAITPADLQQAQLYLNRHDVPAEGRYCLMQSDMHHQFVSGLSTTQYKDYSRAYDERTGMVGTLFGFSIMQRSSTVTVQDDVTSGAVANDIETATGATDQCAAICWQEEAVCRAIGEKKMFNNLNDALYQGDIYSTLVRAGGRRRRSDSKGIVAILQATA